MILIEKSFELPCIIEFRNTHPLRASFSYKNNKKSALFYLAATPLDVKQNMRFLQRFSPAGAGAFPNKVIDTRSILVYLSVLI